MKASTIAAVLSSIAALATAAPINSARWPLGLRRFAGWWYHIPIRYVLKKGNSCLCLGLNTSRWLLLDWDAISLDYAPVTFDQTNGQTRTSYIDVTLKCWGGDGEQNYLPVRVFLRTRLDLDVQLISALVMAPSAGHSFKQFQPSHLRGSHLRHLWRRRLWSWFLR